MKTHEPREIIDPQTGLKKIIYVRTRETQEALERDRLGNFSLLKPINHSGLQKALSTQHLIVITPYLTGQRVITTRLYYDKKPHKVMLGTQLVDSFVRSESYLEGFPSFSQLYIQFSYNESPNRRLADLVNEIVGLRYHLGKHCWLIIPRPLPELAQQWGESLLNLTYLPKIELPAQDGEEVGPSTTAITDRSPRLQSGPITSSMDDSNLPDPKFAKRDKRKRG